jgi:hypothetical protein
MQEGHTMRTRFDKHGQTVGIGDRVRLPTNREGDICGFGWSGGRERAIVRYRLPGTEEVRVPSQLLEKLPGRSAPSRARRGNPLTTRSRGRHPHGESHYRARLSDAEVREMRDLHLRARKGYESLAQIFGCGTSTARDICTGRTRRDA